MVILICVAWAITDLFGEIFGCSPPRHFWNPKEKGTCLATYNQFHLTKEVIATVLEAVILALPMPIISRLHMSRRQKLSLTTIFLLGGL